MEKEIRLIDANALAHQFLLMPGHYRKAEIDLIDSAPTVDAEPVVRGQWIKEEQLDFEGKFRCSVCENTCRVPTCIGDPLYSYCPNCGAKMDLEG